MGSVSGRGGRSFDAGSRWSGGRGSPSDFARGGRLHLPVAAGRAVPSGRAFSVLVAVRAGRLRRFLLARLRARRVRRTRAATALGPRTHLLAASVGSATPRRRPEQRVDVELVERVRSAVGRGSGRHPHASLGRLHDHADLVVQPANGVHGWVRGEASAFQVEPVSQHALTPGGRQLAFRRGLKQRLQPSQPVLGMSRHGRQRRVQQAMVGGRDLGRLGLNPQRVAVVLHVPQSVRRPAAQAKAPRVLPRKAPQHFNGRLDVLRLLQQPLHNDRVNQPGSVVGLAGPVQQQRAGDGQAARVHAVQTAHLAGNAEGHVRNAAFGTTNLNRANQTVGKPQGQRRVFIGCVQQAVVPVAVGRHSELGTPRNVFGVDAQVVSHHVFQRHPQTVGQSLQLLQLPLAEVAARIGQRFLQPGKAVGPTTDQFGRPLQNSLNVGRLSLSVLTAHFVRRAAQPDHAQFRRHRHGFGPRRLVGRRKLRTHGCGRFRRRLCASRFGWPH